MCSDKNTLILGIRHLSSPLIYCPHHIAFNPLSPPHIAFIPLTEGKRRDKQQRHPPTSTDGDTARSSTATATTATTSTTPTTSATTSTVAARLRRHLQQFPSITPPTVPFNHGLRYVHLGFDFKFEVVDYQKLNIY